MKLKTLCCISLSSIFLFSACGQNSNETSHNNNNQKTEKNLILMKPATTKIQIRISQTILMKLKVQMNKLSIQTKL
nr:hypothetical protein [Staphylococcus epidermidis]